MLKLELSVSIQKYLQEQHKKIMGGIVDVIANHVSKPETKKMGTMVGLGEFGFESGLPLHDRETGEEIYYKVTLKTENIEDPEITKAMDEKQIYKPIVH